MKFNIKNNSNFDKFQARKPEIKNQKNLLIDDDNDFILELPEIINEVNNSKLLNIESKEEISITFENFNWFGKIKTKIKNFIARRIEQEDFESSIAHYDTRTKSIHVFNGIIEPKIKIKNKIVQNSYNQLIDSVSNFNFIANFFVLHEIGHAIYDNMNKKNYGNFTDYFKEKTNNALHKEQFLILHENFADMFAAIAYLTIDKNNPNLIKDIELFSQFRKEIKQEKYYTFNNLDKVINDYKTNNLNFSTNEELLEYINVQTNNEIKIRLRERLEGIYNSQKHNQQLAYLSKLFPIEDKSFKGIVSYLEKEINYIKPSSVIYENEFFKTNNFNSEMSKISQRIRKCSEFLISTNNSSKNKNKNQY